MIRSKRSFMAFAHSKRRAYETKTQKKNVPITELVAFAGPLWDQMSLEEKNQYRSVRRPGRNRREWTNGEEVEEEYMDEGMFEVKRDSDGFTVVKAFIFPTAEMDAASRRQELGSTTLCVLFITPRYADGPDCAPLEIACVMFNLEEGITDFESWMLMADVPEQHQPDAKKRAIFTKVGLEPPSDAADYYFTAVDVAKQMSEMLEDVTLPLRLIMGTVGFYNITQGCLGWMREKLMEDRQPFCDAFSSEGLLCVDALVEKFHRTLSNNSGLGIKFPKWTPMVDKRKDTVPLEDICCPYHTKYVPTKAIGCALAAARTIVGEVFNQLLDVGGFERTPQHSIKWEGENEVTEDDEDWMEELEKELETLPISPERQLNVRRPRFEDPADRPGTSNDRY